MLSVARDFALEGFILKRADSMYQLGRRSRDWIKHVCRQRTSVVVGEWIPPRKNPEAVATVLMAPKAAQATSSIAGTSASSG